MSESDHHVHIAVDDAQTYQEAVEIKASNKIGVTKWRQTFHAELDAMSASERAAFEKAFWPLFRKIASEFGKSRRLVITPTADE